MCLDYEWKTQEAPDPNTVLLEVKIMSRGYPQQATIRESLLDRLLDDEPDRQQDDPRTEEQVLRAIQRAVRRDVEDLLNTRYRCEEWPPQHDRLSDSLINYGLPDF